MASAEERLGPAVGGCERRGYVAAQGGRINAYRGAMRSRRALDGTQKRVNCYLSVGVDMIEEGMTMEIHQILAPTDFSEFSKRSVESAHALAQTFGAKLLLLHVVELPPYPIEGLGHSPTGATFLEDLERQASLDLARVLPETPDSRVEVIRQVAVGTPDRKIVEVAEADKVDLIVMATHGRTGLSHLMMGSVAERVVRAAPCPVLTIRPTAATT
jgi:universal stress protein A